MADDIVPTLLEAIQAEFDEKTAKDPKLIAAIKTLQAKKATYLNVNDFSIKLGQILVDVLGNHVTGESLPNGKMYFNIAQRLLDPTMKKNHELISGYALDVQNELNHQAGLHLRGQTAPVNQSRINGIVERVSKEDDFEKIKWILEDPIINFSQSVVDDTIKANVEFQAKLGLQPKITRRVAGHACDWCKVLAGNYDYQKVPEDIYRRHQRCRCTVEYDPKDGRGVQNSHTKVWRDPNEGAKIDVRKTLGLLTPNYTGPSGVSALKRGRVHPQAIPNWQNATISESKLVNYALDINHQDGGPKAREFRDRLGITTDNYRILLNQLPQKLPYYKAIPSNNRGFGDTYVVVIPVEGVNKQFANVFTSWVEDDTGARLTTIRIASRKDLRKWK